MAAGARFALFHGVAAEFPVLWRKRHEWAERIARHLKVELKKSDVTMTALLNGSGKTVSVKPKRAS